MGTFRRGFADLSAALGVAVLAVGVVAGTQVTPSVADTATSTRATTSSATTPTSTTSSVFGASCAGRSCIAVGGESIPVHRELPFAEGWAGGAWAQQTTPEPSRTTMRISQLNAVSCWSATGCIAVGAFWPSSHQERAFAEDMSGSGWELQRHVGPSAPGMYELNGVSCPRARYCVAVGDEARQVGQGPIGTVATLIERWRGRRWVRDPTPNPESGSNTTLTGISCADRRDCVALGSYADPWNRSHLLAEIYAEDEWVIRSPITPRRVQSELESISCPTSTECVVVGSSTLGQFPRLKMQQPLVEYWNGQRWKLQRVPGLDRTFSQLNSISCGSATSCTALGEISGQPVELLAEHWNGRVWRRQAIASPPQLTNPGFLGISCATRRTCAAVVGGLDTSPFTAQLVGNHWTVES